MTKFNVNIKLAELLTIIEQTKSIDDKFIFLEFTDNLKKILKDCYNKGLLDSYDDKKPRITKTN